MDKPTKYREIAADLQRKIESGGLPAGAKLPSDAELSDAYGASRNTVREAVKLLLMRGLVEKQSGRGTFVPTKIDPFLTVITADSGFGGFRVTVTGADGTSRNRRPTVTVPKVEIQKASGDIAAELELEEDLTVVIRHQERYIDDVLWSTQTSYYPMRFVHDRATRLLEVEDIAEGVRRYLESKIGVREVGSHDTMTVRAPDPEEAKAFRIPDDGRIAVFETRQVGVDGDHEPVRVTISIYPADRNLFSMETGALAENAQRQEDSRQEDSQVLAVP
jgi:GntR family transcriptional regulator